MEWWRFISISEPSSRPSAGKRRILDLKPVLQLDLVRPAGDVLGADRREGRPDLGMVFGEEFVDLQALQRRIGDKGELVFRLDLRVEKTPGGILAGFDSVRRVEGEIEEDDELAFRAGASPSPERDGSMEPRPGLPAPARSCFELVMVTGLPYPSA
jgi:hypothetical protein